MGKTRFHCVHQCLVLVYVILQLLNYETHATLSKVQLDNGISHVDGFGEELDKQSIQNLTRCSSTELVLKKESLLYTWEVKGFLSYYVFMQKFQQLFEIKTEEISFKSDIVDGKWFFKLCKVMTAPNVEDLGITATYSYEAKQPKKLNFHINLSIIHDEKEIVLPIQKSTNPMVMQQRLYNRRGYSSYLEYIHTFTWSGVGQAVENILKQSHPLPGEGTNSTEEVDSTFIEDGTFPEGDILLRLLITSYFPSDPVYMGSEACHSPPVFNKGLVRDAYAKDINKRGVNPPYLKHSNSMLHDERFADVLVKIGDQEFLAHRIILATSSAIFSALLTNETDHSALSVIAQNGTIESPNQLFIRLDSDLSSETVTEMLLYIYTGRVNALDKHADKLIYAAEKYGLPELKRMCETILNPRITSHNAIEMYNLGHEVSSNRLVRRAFAVMKANKAGIVSQSEEFKNLTTRHPRLMYELFLA